MVLNSQEDSKRNGNVKLTTTLDGFSQNIGLESRSTKTLKNSTKPTSLNQSILYVEDSHVSRSAPQETEREKQMKDTYGLSSFESFAKLSPDGSFVRMSQDCLQLTLEGHSEEYSPTWPHAGMLSNGILYQRPASGRYTPGTVFSSSDIQWPTPNTMDSLPPKSKSALDHEKLHRPGRSKPNNLRDCVSSLQYWRTPDAGAGGTVSEEALEEMGEGNWVRPSGQRKQLRLQDQVRNPKLFPSPRAREGSTGDIGSKSSIHNAERGYLDGTIQESQSSESELDGGRLNPNFVEYLMGYPQNWTKIE